MSLLQFRMQRCNQIRNIYEHVAVKQPNVSQKATLAAAACWAMAPTTRLRRALASMGAVPALLALLRGTLATNPAAPPTAPVDADKAPSILVQRPLTPREARDALQVMRSPG